MVVVVIVVIVVEILPDWGSGSISESAFSWAIRLTCTSKPAVVVVVVVVMGILEILDVLEIFK